MFRNSWLVSLAGILACAACSSSGPDSAPAPAGRPEIVVTTTILGDVVRQVVGDLASVSVVMPPGASPHEFQASAKQAAAMRKAAILVTNGANFEEGLADSLRAATAEGVPTFEAIAAVPTLTLTGAEAADHGGVDPHFFTDPHRMAMVVRAFAQFVARTVPALAGPALTNRAEQYAASLDALDAEVTSTLAVVPAARRKLVTNHEVFGYFADRYDFEVVGAIVPGGGTQAEPDAKAVKALATTIEQAGVRAIFADTSSPEKLANALAAEVGNVAVVELFTESLGDADSGAGTYVELIRTDAKRIADALSG